MSDAFADFVGSLDFAHAPHWATCYCRYYYSDCSQAEWMERTGEENRNEALAEIKKGLMAGYLAFDGDKCIGWCSANDIDSLIRLKADLESYVSNKKAGCINCFLIHPEYRGLGVATQLMEKAVEGFKEKGFQAVIAIPFENSQSPQKQYRGTMSMFIKAGFQKVGESDIVSIMRLDL